MTNDEYPDFIRSLPRASIPFQDVQAWLGQGTDFQIVFFEIPAGAEIPPHSHGAQFGVVLTGEMSLMIDGRTHRYTRGDTYYIPEGVVHSGKFHTFVRVIDIFADSDRYQALNSTSKTV